MLDRFKFKNILSFSAYLEGTSVACPKNKQILIIISNNKTNAIA
jgi:hypothetical protein